MSKDNIPADYDHLKEAEWQNTMGRRPCVQIHW